MGKVLRLALMGIVGVALVGGLLYWAGFRVVRPAGDNGGIPKNKPGWRRSEDAMARAVPPGSAGRANRSSQSGQEAPGNGAGQQRGGGGDGSGVGNGGGNAPGSRAGRQQGGGGQGTKAAGRQPGFGPSGGILLPTKIGTVAVPVSIGGKGKSSFVGQDLVDHVEDTVIATADGPRKGWAIAKTLTYLGINNYKEATLIGSGGRKVVVSRQQLQDEHTIPLLTYNENGQLMAVSGPKVRGANKGNITVDDVKKIVAGRTDLINLSGIEKIEITS
jgi:hypothetical protein